MLEGIDDSLDDSDTAVTGDFDDGTGEINRQHLIDGSVVAVMKSSQSDLSWKIGQGS